MIVYFQQRMTGVVEYLNISPSMAMDMHWVGALCPCQKPILVENNVHMQFHSPRQSCTRSPRHQVVVRFSSVLQPSPWYASSSCSHACVSENFPSSVASESPRCSLLVWKLLLFPCLFRLTFLQLRQQERRPKRTAQLLPGLDLLHLHVLHLKANTQSVDCKVIWSRFQKGQVVDSEGQRWIQE